MQGAVKVNAALSVTIVSFVVEFHFQFTDQPKNALKLCDTEKQCNAVSDAGRRGALLQCTQHCCCCSQQGCTWKVQALPQQQHANNCLLCNCIELAYCIAVTQLQQKHATSTLVRVVHSM